LLKSALSFVFSNEEKPKRNLPISEAENKKVKNGETQSFSEFGKMFPQSALSCRF